MGMGNNLQFVRRLIYNLKRRYGVPLDFYINDVTPGDPATGKKNVVREKYSIARAIATTQGFTTLQLFTAAFMRNIGRDFAFGANFEKDTVQVLIDARDLPVGIRITPERSYIVLNNRRYLVAKASLLEGNTVHSLTVKAVEGSPVQQLLTPITQQSIRFSQTVKAVIN